MPKLVGRHSLSEANNRNNYGTPAFGHAGAPLMPEGRSMAKEMGEEFRFVYGIIRVRTPVAVSKMLRSQETAREAGFILLREYECLNEVDTKLPLPELKESIINRRQTAAALKAAELLLQTPPPEEVWITHGLVIAGLCELLGIADRYEHFIPKFCEIRELPI
jgi:hypothetical protein